MDGMDMESEIAELINRRRRQIMLHSCIYYRFTTSIITDKQFDTWSYELVALQQTYPEISSRCIFYNDFKNFDGTTGFDFPYYDWLDRKALYHIQMHKEEMKNGVPLTLE